MEDLLNQTITTVTATRDAKTGDYSSLTDQDTLDCRIVDAIRFIPSRETKGESINITKTMWSKTELAINSIIKYDSSYYLVQYVEEWRDEDGDLFGAKHLLSNYVV